MMTGSTAAEGRGRRRRREMEGGGETAGKKGMQKGACAREMDGWMRAGVDIDWDPGRGHALC